MSLVSNNDVNFELGISDYSSWEKYKLEILYEFFDFITSLNLVLGKFIT